MGLLDTAVNMSHNEQVSPVLNFGMHWNAKLACISDLLNLHVHDWIYKVYCSVIAEYIKFNIPRNKCFSSDNFLYNTS